VKFDAAFDKWLAANDAGMSEGSRSAYTFAVRRFAAFCKAHRLQVEDVHKRHIAAYMAEATDEIKGWTVMGQVKLLKRVFEWAVAEGLAETNPVQLKSLPKLVRHRADRTAFTADDYAAIMEHVGAAKPYWRLACALAWHTGLRMVDVANLQWEHVDFSVRVLSVKPIKLQRFGQQLEIPMADELYEALIQRHTESTTEEPGEYVQPDMMMAYKYGRTRLVEQFEQLRKRAGLSGGSFHSFRHAVATRLINAGADSLVVASITGHSLKQLKEYTHVSMEAKRNAFSIAQKVLTPPFRNENLRTALERL